MDIQSAIAAEMNRNAAVVKQVIVARDKVHSEPIDQCHRTNVMK